MLREQTAARDGRRSVVPVGCGTGRTGPRGRQWRREELCGAVVRDFEGPNSELRRLLSDEGDEDCGELHERVLPLVKPIEESHDPKETSGRD